jgi:hypothetical protein
MADSESRDFLKALAALAGMNSPDAWMAGGGHIIRSEIQSEIERSSEWQRHQEKLLELADAPDNAVVPTIAEQRVPLMPTDIAGKLYRTFDSYRIGISISEQIAVWVERDLGLARPSPPQAT